MTVQPLTMTVIIGLTSIKLKWNSGADLEAGLSFSQGDSMETHQTSSIRLGANTKILLEFLVNFSKAEKQQFLQFGLRFKAAEFIFSLIFSYSSRVI